MNFFKSVFADDPDPPSTSGPESSSSDSTTSIPQQQHPLDQDSAPDSDLPEPAPESSTDTSGGLWDLGALVKTLTTRSESVIETYRRDLKEFSSGLKNETLTLREVANRAMKELPSSIEVTATKAQGAIDSIGSSVAEIIAQGKETLLSADLDSSDDSSGVGGRSSSYSKDSVSSVGRYSRFDAQLRVIQCDANTYLQEPDSGSADEYERWRSGFQLEEKRDEIEGLIGENGVMSEMYKKLVPGSVDHEKFWCRYYYRVRRLEQAASVRAKLVKRVESMDEEELSWDVDDDEEEDEEEEAVDEPVKKVSDDFPVVSNKFGNEGIKIDDDTSKSVEEVKGVTEVVGDKREQELESRTVDCGEKSNVNEPITDDNAANDNEVLLKDTPESKKDQLPLTKDSSDKVVSSAEGKECSQKQDDPVQTKQQQQQQSQEEEDLDWDEIEDLGSGDEKKVIPSGSSNKAEVRKRLSAAEVDDDDEDLSWDIEDDDQPMKS